MKRFTKFGKFTATDLLASEFMPILSAIAKVVVHLEGEDPNRIRDSLADVISRNGHPLAIRALVDELFRFHPSRAQQRSGSWLVSDPASWTTALENLGLELRSAMDEHGRAMPW
jgi:hypothetical protein